MPLYRVHKMRRRDRRRHPWLLWWHDPPGPSGRVRSQTIGSMGERLAERHREAWQAELNALAGDDEGGRTWQAFRDRYVAAVEADLAPATAGLARWTLDRFAARAAPRRLVDVGVETVETYRVARLAEVGRETVRKEIRTLRAAFAWAHRQGWIERNPCDGVRFGRRERRDPDAMTPAETRRFLGALEREPTWIRAALRLAVLWGPRTGELAGLRRDDVDFAGRTLRVASARGRTTKTGRGRTLPLDAETAGLLQEISHQDGPILWGAWDARLPSARVFRDRLVLEGRRVFAAAGAHLPADGHLLQHLRRTAETAMRRRGVPDWQIGRVLGHGTAVGEAWYNGMGDEELARQVEGLMRRSSGQRSPGGLQGTEPRPDENPETDVTGGDAGT